MGMYTWEDVAAICDCSKGKAYNIIRSLNNILIKQGASKGGIVAGKISKKFFHETLKI